MQQAQHDHQALHSARLRSSAAPTDATSRIPTRLQAAAGEWQQCERRFAVRGPVAKGVRPRRKEARLRDGEPDSDMIGDVLGDLEKGVYAAFYQTAKTTEPKRAVVNVGVAPTFEGQEQPVKLVEAHLLDHDGSDLYGDAAGAR